MTVESQAQRQVEPKLLCPSAQPEMEAAQVLGVLDTSEGTTRLAYLQERLAVSNGVLEMAKDVPPTRVFRFAARCDTTACSHFDGADCRLAKRVVEGFQPSSAKPPPCLIRRDCRWFAQEGRAACVRCSQVVTEITAPTAELIAIALGQSV